MQSHVMELAYKALDLHEISYCQAIAHYIKQVEMMEFLVFKVGKDLYESKDEAVGVLQRAED
ncbi:hypothetical protein RJ641_024699, partial [Dillenia turbinata]